MTAKDSTPTPRKNELDFAELDGPDGRFWIAFAGLRPDTEFGFGYRDGRASFAFYAAFNLKANSWNVSNATYGIPWTGMYFKSSEENDVVFQRNIVLFFDSRRCTEPRRLRDTNEKQGATTFSWKISR